MHIGHARTYLVPDIIARWKRMKGYDVLFPMGFHLTGTPIVGSVERIRDGDAAYLRLLKEVFGVSDEEIESGKLEDPESFARYFIDESSLGYKSGMKKLGLSIDWSRECTSIDPQFKRMVEWQFRKLHKTGLVRKGEHPVKYCPKDDNPVTDHDLLEGEGVSIIEFTLIKYRGEDGAFYPSATLRPETVFGVTNLWVNPKADYLMIEVGKESWVVSEECAKKLPFQGKSTSPPKKRIPGEELIGRAVTNPVTGEVVDILPAEFVDPDNGTGVVNSVPAHAPYDYIALKDLGSDIEPIVVIEVPGHGLVTEELIARLGIKDQRSEKLEDATTRAYNLEFSKGVIVDTIPKYGGKRVNQAKEEIKRELLGAHLADLMWEFDEKPVQCRCGAECVVKLVKDQWFLRYSDEKWKKKVRSYLDELDLVPRGSRGYFRNVLSWLEDWPCTRKVGLGTRLPWDDKWIIESLSDSTIYMAYYTIAPYVKEMDPDLIDDDVYDYILLGRGDPRDISEKGLDEKLLKKARESFVYWYPLDVRYSANELIPNHLTFMLYHHLAIFPKELAPRGIVTFGMGVLEGKKMSSSKGNIYPISKAIEELGTDGTRYYLTCLSEPWQDFDFRRGQALTTSRIIERIRTTVKNGLELEPDRQKPEWIDRWLLSVFQRSVEKTNRALASYQTRKGVLSAVDETFRNLRWYLRRGGDRIGILEDWIRLMDPFIPNLTRELWELIGKDGDVEGESYPEFDGSLIDEDAEGREKLIQDTMEDIAKIVDVALRKEKRDERGIRVVVAKGEGWELETLKSAIPIYKERFGMGVKVEMGGKEKKEPLPGRPAIYIE
jgi:leucyl-tRNA synthetase